MGEKRNKKVCVTLSKICHVLLSLRSISSCKLFNMHKHSTSVNKPSAEANNNQNPCCMFTHWPPPLPETKASSRSREIFGVFFKNCCNTCLVHQRETFFNKCGINRKQLAKCTKQFIQKKSFYLRSTYLKGMYRKQNTITCR